MSVQLTYIAGMGQNICLHILEAILAEMDNKDIIGFHRNMDQSVLYVTRKMFRKGTYTQSWLLGATILFDILGCIWELRSPVTFWGVEMCHKNSVICTIKWYSKTYQIRLLGFTLLTHFKLHIMPTQQVLYQPTIYPESMAHIIQGHMESL